MTLRRSGGNLSTLMALTACLNACGIGTEVGNGNKPAKGQGGNHDTAPASTPEDAKADGDNSTGGEGSTANPLMPDFTLDVLLASCGSPFGDDLQGPLSLGSLAEGGSYANRFDADRVEATWSITDEAGNLLRQATSEGTGYTVLTVDASGAKAAAEYQCTEVIETENVAVEGLEEAGALTSKSLIVSLDDLHIRVTWYVDPAAAPQTLKRIDLDDIDDEKEALLLEVIPAGE